MGVRLASPNPSCCSACYGQHPERRHVDFEAASDGPVIVSEDGVPRTWTGGTMTVEEVIICETCLQSAVEILALEPVKMEGLAQELRAAQAEAREWKGRAAALQQAVAAWGEPADPPDPPASKAKPAPPKQRKVTVRVSDELKALAVERVQAGEAVAAIAQEHGVTTEAVRYWMRQAQPGPANA